MFSWGIKYGKLLLLLLALVADSRNKPAKDSRRLSAASFPFLVRFLAKCSVKSQAKDNVPVRQEKRQSILCNLYPKPKLNLAHLKRKRSEMDLKMCFSVKKNILSLCKSFVFENETFLNYDCEYKVCGV